MDEFLSNRMLQGVLLLLFGVSSVTHASLLFEPQFGSIVSGQESGAVAESHANQRLRGNNYGGRVGLLGEHWMTGLEYMRGDLRIQNSENVTLLKQSNVGAFLGYQWESGFRFYGTYFFSAHEEVQTLPITRLKGGYAAKLGLGYTIFSGLALNVEYYYSQHDRIDQGLGSIALSPAEKLSYWLVSLSFPLALF